MTNNEKEVILFYSYIMRIIMTIQSGELWHILTEDYIPSHLVKDCKVCIRI